MQPKTNAMSGQCLCGGIRYEVDKLEPKMGNCHCTMCRKFHGAAFATYGEAEHKHFRWVKGEQLLRSYSAENGATRQFCEVCGSSLIFISANPNQATMEFALATLDSTPERKPGVHVYTQHKASRYRHL